MELNEKHHAHIIAVFYEELKKKGEQGFAVFKKGAQQYGEERGRRMALRALRDKHPLSYLEYFAYSEWESTPGFYEMTMRAEVGMVDEKVTKCPWASLFAELGIKDCGALYCHEIDRAIVRGFNPELCLELQSTQHYEGLCSFLFKDHNIEETLLEQAEELKKEQEGRNVLPMAYHCAHVRDVFSRIILDVWGSEGEDIIRRAELKLEKRLGAEAIEELGKYEKEDFTRLPKKVEQEVKLGD